MPLDHRLEIEILAHGPRFEGDHRGAVTAKQQDAIAHNAITQRQWRLVEDRHVHFIKVKYVHQPANDLEANIKAMTIVWLTGQQHCHIYIGQRPGLAARV